jgi:trigger factor
VEGCKHSIEFTVPVEEVEAETQRAVAEVQKKARLKGFRPGKAPTRIIREYYGPEIRKKVLDSVIPKHLQQRFEQDNLNVVSRPDITDVHFHEGEPLRFKAEFEVSPAIELKEFQGLTVPYNDPQVTDADIDQRLEELREQKAEYVNVDPRRLADGDYAVLALESINLPANEAVKNDEMMLEIGGKDTFEDFSRNLRGLSPGDEKEFDVAYPEDSAQRRLAGKTVAFKAVVKGLRRKELPELNDDFAQDLGDFRDLGELRETVRKSLFAQREYEAQQKAKQNLVDQIVDAHEFPVPEVFVEGQIQNRVQQQLRGLAAEGVDPRQFKIDWERVKESQRDSAVREVKASMLLSRIAEREAIHATREEVDRELERLARQQREPIAAVRMKLEKDGTLGRIASHIQTEKTLNFLFEHATKVAE